MKIGLWLLGGILAGGGMLTMTLGGIGAPGGDVATQISKVGFDAIPEIAFTSSGMAALAMLVVGIGLMATASSSAWKETGGY